MEKPRHYCRNAKLHFEMTFSLSSNLKFLTFMFSGSTYGTFRRELEREVVTLIPFTCVDTFRGHLEKVSVM